jgi:hypothetical protein
MKKLFLILLIFFGQVNCVHTEVRSFRAPTACDYADYAAPVASYTVLRLMGNEHSFWLSFPSCIGGFVVENITTIIASGLLNGISEATRAGIIDKIAAIARITGAAVTAHAIAKFSKSQKASKSPEEPSIVPMPLKDA